ncbi:hypothetical protein MXB_5685, partial [Myxobolus squamalis]
MDDIRIFTTELSSSILGSFGQLSAQLGLKINQSKCSIVCGFARIPKQFPPMPFSYCSKENKYKYLGVKILFLPSVSATRDELEKAILKGLRDAIKINLSAKNSVSLINQFVLSKITFFLFLNVFSP